MLHRGLEIAYDIWEVRREDGGWIKFKDTTSNNNTATVSETIASVINTEVPTDQTGLAVSLIDQDPPSQIDHQSLVAMPLDTDTAITTGAVESNPDNTACNGDYSEVLELDVVIKDAKQDQETSNDTDSVNSKECTSSSSEDENVLCHAIISYDITRHPHALFSMVSHNVDNVVLNYKSHSLL